MFTNINAKENLEQGFEVSFFANLDFLESIFEKDKVFLINKETMNKIYPSKKRFSLDKECLKEMLMPFKERKFDYDEQFSFVDEFMYRLDICRRKTSSVVAVGVFVPDLPEDLAKELNLNNTRESIFICPERLNRWALEVNSDLSGLSESFIKKIMTSKILFHELAHKYMYNPSDANRYSVGWRNLIEESLANAIAFKLLSSDSLETKAILSRAIQSQPFEYRQYRYWLNNKKIGFFERLSDFFFSCLEPIERINLPLIARLWKLYGNFNVSRDWWDNCEHMLRYYDYYGYRRIRNFVQNIHYKTCFWKMISMQMIKQAVL